MAKDNLSGHTSAQNSLGQDGLRDGDSLSPSTLTNLLQGIQGNGILRLHKMVLTGLRETNLTAVINRVLLSKTPVV